MKKEIEIEIEIDSVKPFANSIMFLKLVRSIAFDANVTTKTKKKIKKEFEPALMLVTYDNGQVEEFHILKSDIYPIKERVEMNYHYFMFNDSSKPIIDKYNRVIPYDALYEA